MNDKEKLQKWFNDIVSERTTDTEPLRFGRVMPFGKHKGEHVYWLLVTYPSYMNWITNNTSYRLSEVEEWWRATLDEQRSFERRVNMLDLASEIFKHDPVSMCPHIDNPHWIVE